MTIGEMKNKQGIMTTSESRYINMDLSEELNFKSPKESRPNTSDVISFDLKLW